MHFVILLPDPITQVLVVSMHINQHAFCSRLPDPNAVKICRQSKLLESLSSLHFLTDIRAWQTC